MKIPVHQGQSYCCEEFFFVVLLTHLAQCSISIPPENVRTYPDTVMENWAKMG